MKRTVALALTFGLVAATGAAQTPDRRTTRFAAMDTNNDGVVTQKEWRGTARSFQTHDWNRDGILSGEEVQPGGRRREQAREAPPFDSADREYAYDDWTARGFTALDHNSDGRITRDEWHFDVESFRRADHNRDNILSRAEFLGESDEDDDRDDRFSYLDANEDGRVSRAEWHGTPERFTALDDNRDGQLTRVEMRGGNEPPADLFTSVDVNRDGAVSRDEWHWSRATFDRRDNNNDNRLTRQEFGTAAPATAQSPAWRQGEQRGLTEGRQAGKEDKDRNQGWDLEGQRELEEADSGYEARFGARADYQAGYREGFRRGYREGWGPR